jgi:hypothetical protein
MKIRREGTTLFENICRITLKKLPYLTAFVNHPISPYFAINHSPRKTAHLSFFIFYYLDRTYMLWLISNWATKYGVYHEDL